LTIWLDLVPIKSVQAQKRWGPMRPTWGLGALGALEKVDWLMEEKDDDGGGPVGCVERLPYGRPPHRRRGFPPPAKDLEGNHSNLRSQTRPLQTLRRQRHAVCAFTSAGTGSG